MYSNEQTVGLMAHRSASIKRHSCLASWTGHANAPLAGPREKGPGLAEAATTGHRIYRQVTSEQQTATVVLRPTAQ